MPSLILGKKVFNCQHGVDRTAGEKRKRKDAKEVLYIISSFIRDFCVTTVTYSLLIRNVKCTHEWVIRHWSQNTFRTNVITIQSRLSSLEVNNYKNFSLVYAAYKRENIRNSAFFAFYQAIICWLLITLWHFRFVTFQKITWEIQYHSSYAVIFTYYRRLETKIFFQEKKISCSRHKEVWLQSTDKNARNFIFSENKVVLLMYK